MQSDEVDVVSVEAPVSKPQVRAVDKKLAKWLEGWFDTSATTYPLARPEDIRRFVPAGLEAPPRRLWRIVGEEVEKWTAVRECVKSDDLVDIACSTGYGRYGMQRIIGWTVERRRLPQHCECLRARLVMRDGDLIHDEGCGRARQSRVSGPIGDHVASLRLGPPDDDTYNGHYPTLAGNDVVHLNPAGKRQWDRKEGRWVPTMEQFREGEIIRDRDGAPLRGGREIRGGRAEFREATKDGIIWDAGTRRDLAKIEKEKKAQKKQDMHSLIKRTVLRGPRKLGEL